MFYLSDRVFGTLEREFLKRKEIHKPEEYIEVISKRATVSRLGDNCTIYDFKKKENDLSKNQQTCFLNLMSTKNILLLYP